MEDQKVVLVKEVSVVAPAVVMRAVEAVLQMDVAETAQAVDHLLVQEADAVVLQTDVAVLQMDVAEIAQATDYLLVQEADAVVLQTDIAVLQMDAVLQTDGVILHLQEEAAVLQAMEDVAAKKVVLLQADKFCIETIKENRASALFFLSHDFLKNILWQQKPQPVQMVRKKAANWKNFSLIN